MHERDCDKTRHIPFLAFATKNRNRATARFRFFYTYRSNCFLHVCLSLFVLRLIFVRLKTAPTR